MDNINDFPNDDDRVNPEDIYSPTEKEVREYMAMGHTRSDAITSLRSKNRDDEFDPYEEGDAERMDEIRNPRISMDDMMLKVNQHYGPPRD